MPETHSPAQCLANNLRQLRKDRRLTQQQLGKMSGIPRATWANLESGSANPTLSVLTRVAETLGVSIEELISAPRATCQLYRADALPTRQRGRVVVRQLLPDPLPGLEVERLALPANTRLTGVPHTTGTREYLTCESGRLSITVSGNTRTLDPGDVLVFRGDQRHSYHNPGPEPAVAYSTIIFTPDSN